MTTEISNDMSRLELLDSSFQAIIRQDNEMEIIFNWSKLANFSEQGISEPIIIGRTTMHLTGVSSEEFKINVGDDLKNFSTISFPDDIIKGLERIGTNEIDDNNRKVKIGGLYKREGKLQWVEWSFGFDTCKISWKSHITRTEWLNGKLPED